MKHIQQVNATADSYPRGLDDAPEFVVFSACLVIIEVLRALAQKLARGEVGQAAFSHQAQLLLARLRRTAEVTQRFDIVLPVADSSNFSPYFWQWFNWWFDYSIALTPGQVEKLERLAQKRRKTVAKHRPKGDWLTYRRTPAVVVQMIAESSQP